LLCPVGTNPPWNHPHVICRAFVEDTLAHSSEEEKADYGVIKEKIRADLKRYISKQTQKRPLIMPVILEI
jgi:ribonuclease J